MTSILKTTTYSAIVALVMAGLLLGATAIAKGPANKATGEVTWTARTSQPVDQQIPGIVSDFNAHDLGPGMVDKGMMAITIPENNVVGNGTRVYDIACANVTDGQAWFAGTVVEADGDFADTVGDVNLYWVMDDSTPGAPADKIGGLGYNTLAQACGVVDNGDWTGTGDVTAGNLKVHYRD